MRVSQAGGRAGQEAQELPQGGSLRDSVDTSVTLKRTLSRRLVAEQGRPRGFAENRRMASYVGARMCRRGEAAAPAHGIKRVILSTQGAASRIGTVLAL